MRRHDGVYRWFLHRAEPIRNEQGQIVKWLGTSTDIHEQKLTEQALRRSNEDLEQFAYAASHDLQEPLRTVSIFTQLLARKFHSEDEDIQRYVHYVVSGTRQMDSLFQGLLEYSRAGHAEEATETTDSEAVLAHALHNLEAAIAESGAAITHGRLPEVEFPRFHLLALLQNTIGNALKYRSARAPRIHVSAVREGRWERFSVSDNGIGIGEDYLERIFGMFKRLHKDEYPGVGVGLAICKRVVDRQGGRIWAESELGQGTTIYFTLPAAGRE
jgi:light-regulated signal transduction histidine kinase (bacteriophytochrome)